MSICGICHQSSEILRNRHQQGHHDSTEALMNCSSCANMLLLKPKVQYLDLMMFLNQARNEINGVLEKSLESKVKSNVKFLEEYVDKHHKDGKLPEKSEDTPGELSIPDSSIALLSSQLLTVQTRIITKKVQKMEAIIAKKRQIVDEVLLRKKLQKEAVLKAKREKYEVNAKKLEDSYNAKKQRLKNQIKEKKLEISKLNLSIDNSQAILFQSLCKFILVKKYYIRDYEIDGMGAKSNNNEGVKRHRNFLAIGFHPIFPVEKYIHYNSTLITSSLESICQFLYYTSYYLSIILPFRVEPPSESTNGSYVIHGLHENFDFRFFKVKFDKNYAFKGSNNGSNLHIPPRNLLLILNNYSYDQTFNSKNKIGLAESLIKLNSVQMFEFSIVLAKIILNLYVMCSKLNIITSERDDFDTYSKLFCIDEMIYSLVTGGSKFHEEHKRSYSNHGVQQYLKEQLVLPKRSFSQEKGSLLKPFWKHGDKESTEENEEKMENEESFEANFDSYIEVKSDQDKQLKDYDNNDQKIVELSLADISFRIFSVLHHQTIVLNQGRETVAEGKDSSVSPQKAKKKHRKLKTSQTSLPRNWSTLSVASKERIAYYGDKDSVNSNDWQMV